MEIITNSLIQSNQTVRQDVVCLLTNVPTEEVLSVVRDRLTSDSSLGDHTSISIHNIVTLFALTTYFGIISNIFRDYH